MTASISRDGAPSVWVLLDDRAGGTSQSLGVAEALGPRFETRDLEYAASAALPNFVLGASFGGLTANSRVNMVPPWPDLVIASGRRTAPVARTIKRRNGGRTLLVQIMYPGDAGVDEFDLIAAPRHDGVGERANLIQITGAPHRVEAGKLARAADEWRHRLAGLPRPRIALIVGGSTRRRRFTDDMARELGGMVSRMAGDAGGSLMITTSRRSGAAAEVLLGAIEAPSHVFRWHDGGDNPYFGYLGLADGVVVTGDSVSMCSEACAVPGPVYIYAPKDLTTPKHARLHRDLFDQGYARPLGDTFETWNHPPLNAAGEVAAAIRERFPLVAPA